MNKTQVYSNIVDKVLDSHILSLLFIEGLLILLLVCILKCICIIEDRRSSHVQRKSSSSSHMQLKSSKIRPTDLI